jgi:pimeloyl-ACP methyl ester carboxylesterase
MKKVGKSDRISTDMLPIQNKIPILRSIHWAAAHAMRQAGYRWELRRSGELKIGLWRKSLNSGKSKSDPKKNRKLVLIPGFGDTPMSWMGVLALLRTSVKKNYDEVILVDFPGFSGFLSHEKAFHSMELLKNSLFDILDSLAPKTLMGHSLGGWLATLYAVECEEGSRPKVNPAGLHANFQRPENLILADPSGVFEDEAATQELRDKFGKAVGSHSGFDTIRQHVFAREPFWIRWLAGQFSGFFESQEVARFVESFERAHLIDEARLEKIKSKVWLIWGEKDTLVPPTSIPIFLKKLNQDRALCRAILIKNAGHSPQVEAPLALAAVLSQVLVEASGGRARFYNLPASQLFWKLVEEC